MRSHAAGNLDLHERFGAGMPDYATFAPDLFEWSRRMSLQGVVAERPALVTNNYVDTRVDSLAAHLKAQHSAEWLFYQPRNSEEHLTPHEFRTAMAIRCGTLPLETRNRYTSFRCNCGFTPVNTDDVLAHVFRCQAASTHTSSQRHNAVKYAIARALREFGVGHSVEPRFYEYADAARRPDITAHGTPPAAIDIVISCQDGELGDRATWWAQEKRRIHEASVTNKGHMFFPFALEVHGHAHEDVFKFIEHVARDLKPYERPAFKARVEHAVSSALAKAVVDCMPQVRGTRLL